MPPAGVAPRGDQHRRGKPRRLCAAKLHREVSVVLDVEARAHVFTVVSSFLGLSVAVVIFPDTRVHSRPGDLWRYDSSASVR